MQILIVKKCALRKNRWKKTEFKIIDYIKSLTSSQAL